MYVGSRRGRRPLRPAVDVVVALVAAALVLVVGSGSVSPADAAGTSQPDPSPSATTSTSTTPAPGSDARVATPSRSAEETDEPLDVELTGLTPAVVPARGAVQLVGTVRNDSDQTWQDINVHTWVSTSPLTTTDALAEAAATPADADVGVRLTSEHGFVAVGDLAPGEQTAFTLRVPREELTIPDVPGVYFVGVQALGTGADGREVAGRARSFMPVVTGRRPRADVAVVVPFRETVQRDADAAGRLHDLSDWRSLLTADGRLERLLGFAESAGSSPVTLLVDPAVLDAVASLSQEDTADSGDSGTSAADVARAKAWLVRMKAVASRAAVLGLGYADPDDAALAHRQPGLLAAATTLSASTFARNGIDAAPAAAPPDGSLPPRFSDLLAPTTLLLLSDRAVTSDTSLVRSRGGQPLAAASSAVSRGGPAPTAASAALAMRQRVVAEASLRRTGARDPLVVQLPADWDPGPDWSAADFFTGLDLPWLRLVRLTPDAVPADAPTAAGVAYPESLAARQLSRTQVEAVQDARRQARIYADALTEPGAVVDRLTKIALEGASVHSRSERSDALDRTRALTASLRERLAGVRVEGFPLVTMSGGTGRFTVTLVNDLDRPVKVGLKARTSGDIRVQTPAPEVLPAGQRTTIKLQVSAGESRVRSVLLTPETSNGYAVGTPLRFSVRNSRVSSLVWGVLAGALLLLLFTIGRRAIRRGGLRRERSATG